MSKLQAVIARASELLKQHDRGRKEKALAGARMILPAELSLKGVAAKSKGSKPAKAPIYRGGRSLSGSVETGVGVECHGAEAPLVAGVGKTGEERCGTAYATGARFGTRRLRDCNCGSTAL